jgi:adenylyltransferase/sulfurtransferase
MPEVRIHVPMPLRDLVAGEASVVVEAASVDDALASVRGRHPTLAARLLEASGQVRPHVNLFLDGRDVRALAEEEREIDKPAELVIVPSIAGGMDDLSRDERIRYQRQLLLPEFGIAGQQRLREAGVLVIGAGGLGSPAALYLAAAGVGRIGIADSDSVEVSNLHRQVLHDTASIGTLKTSSARKRLEALNPDVEVVEISRRLNADNATELMTGWDVIVDGSDNFPTRYLVNETCVSLGIPLAYGAVVRFDGQASVFAADEGPCYRCLFRDPPPAGSSPGCSEAGVLGALPGIVGSIQAAETIKLITGMGTPLIGRLLLIDALEGDFRSMEIQRDPECPTCGSGAATTALEEEEPQKPLFSLPRGFKLPVPLPAIDALELKELLESGRQLVLIDVREPSELAISTLEPLGAFCLPVEELEARIEELEHGVEMVLFCRTGSRSMEAVEFLHSRGFVRTLSLTGGINGWARDVDPSLATY